VVGYIFCGDGEPAASTQVKLIPVGHDPSAAIGTDNLMVDTTDIRGCYLFDKVIHGKYNVQALHLTKRTRMLITGVEAAQDTTIVPSDSLMIPGSIALILPEDNPEGYAAIPGTDIVLYAAAGSTKIVLDSVPPGLIPEIRYVAQGDTAVMSRQYIPVKSSDTTILSNLLWKYQMSITLNTSAAGADTKNNVYGFPVLVRLSSANFHFTEAKSDGSDIRFTSSSGDALPFEIEQWDAVTEHAAVWVKVDTVYGNDSTQKFIMYWGNIAASDLSKSTDVFDTAAGFQGVWHMNEIGNISANDATNNDFDGTAYHMSASESNSGMIGNARTFDGDSSYITMPNTADSKLDFPQDGYFTISAWVYADTIDNVYRTILTKGYEQYFLQLSYFPGDDPLWQFSVFRKEDNWNMSHTGAIQKQWVLLTGVRQGTDQYLYCNGVLVANTSAVYPQNTSRNTTNDLSIGRFLKEATYPTNFGYCFFKGSIDEVRICSVARNSDWIKLSYMNQKTDNRLVEIK